MIAKDLLDSFDRSLADKRNERGGVYRAGTGTAMYYIFHSNQLRATPDGRNDGEMIPANYSPSLFLKQKNLIVRVWGWSGYFVELDECYQNHVINRIEFGL